MDSISNEHSVARLKFYNQFPYGYILIPTSTVGLLCGLHALRASLGAHGPGLFPTVQQLLDIWNSRHITDTTECGVVAGFLDANNHLYIDQLAIILQILGKQIGLELQLGYILEDTRAFLYPNPTSPDTRIIWIRSSSKTGADDDIIHHFEGIRRPPTPASHDYSSTSSEDDDMADETGSEGTATDAGNSPSRLSEHSLPNCQGSVFPSTEDPRPGFMDFDEALWRKTFL